MAKSNKTNSYIWSYNDIERAYDSCIKNKRHSNGAKTFNENKLENLFKLLEKLNDGTYEIRHSYTFIVEKPVCREVFAADFSDRIVHHLVINETLKYFEKEFCNTAYACRKNMGVLYGVDSIFKQLEDITNNYTEDAYVLKLDLKSFFMSIDKQLLTDMVTQFLEEKYPNNKKKQPLMALFQQIIMNRPEQDCLKVGDINLWGKLEKGKSLFDTNGERGLPIGNLTSQILANFYLNPLDRYITQELGFKYYGRYVDDFIVIDKDKTKLLQAVKLIEEFCKNKLHITLHPKKRQILHYSKGFRFIGAVIQKDRKYTIDRTRGYVKSLVDKYKKPNLDKADILFRSINSYFGFLRQTSSYRFRKKILKQILEDYGWNKYFHSDENYAKLLYNDETKERLRDNLFKTLRF